MTDWTTWQDDSAGAPAREPPARPMVTVVRREDKPRVFRWSIRYSRNGQSFETPEAASMEHAYDDYRRIGL